MNIRKPACRAGSENAENGHLALLFAVVLAGCQSAQFSYYIAPRVTGRVLDAATRAPLKGAVVRRMVPNYNANAMEPRKGGIIMEQANRAVSDAAGRFALASERDLSLFTHAGWWSVTLSFNAYGYERFQTNFTLAHSTNTREGVPLVEAGDILLRQATR